MAPNPEPHVHGTKGVYHGGDWLDIEDCDGVFSVKESGTSCQGCDKPCPRSRSRNSAADASNAKTEAETSAASSEFDYDVVIIGAGCIGAAIARELSKTTLSDQGRILWVEAADDVSQGATKGNSGIVHAGYDDTPGSVRAKYCWPGNQMFPQLDKELRFGYQKNGSLVVAMNNGSDREELDNLLKRGQINGVTGLRIVEKEELFQLEPHLNPNAVAALYATEAGNVIPYEFAIALAENAVDNGVELRIRRTVTDIEPTTTAENIQDGFTISMDYWEPNEYVTALESASLKDFWVKQALLGAGVIVFTHFLVAKYTGMLPLGDVRIHVTALVGILVAINQGGNSVGGAAPTSAIKKTPFIDLVKRAGRAVGIGADAIVDTRDMLVGGSGSPAVQKGTVVATETVTCRYIINCAGGASDLIARMIGDDSFTIKPRLGDYLLLHKKQGSLVKRTIFPCPDPVLGKGVLVQTTLWGNLILGPTARDMHKPEARDMTPEQIQQFIITKCKELVPSLDEKQTIHAFCGARAKSDRGDWIIEPSQKNKQMIHVAGIDSPGLAGSPAIAVDVVKILNQAGLTTQLNPNFNPNRAPIIIPKQGLKGLKMGPVEKLSDTHGDLAAAEKLMSENVICKCEKVTELEIVRALHRSLPIDSSQGIRKRTRAGMGSCQADPDGYNCEGRVKAIIARENGVPVDQVGGRPWPATSTLTHRWVYNEEKKKNKQ